MEIASTTVPFGTFDAVVIDQSISIGPASTTLRFFLVNHIGPLKFVEDLLGQNGASVTVEMVALTVPEPSLIVAMAFGAVFLAGTGTGRRK